MARRNDVPSNSSDDELEWDLTFHGVHYIITIKLSESVLLIEAEEYNSSDRWSTEFTSQYVEEITLKAGSFKKFQVFSKMLMSALDRDNPTVFVDLLTFTDLEVLKARKNGSPPNSNLNNDDSNLSKSGDSIRKHNNNKRYLILTYSNEYDRVHYPLPLTHVDINANPKGLLRTIHRLRKALELEKATTSRDANAEPPSVDERQLRQMIVSLKKENYELKSALRELKESSSPNDGSEEVARLRRENIKLRKALANSRTDNTESNQNHKKNYLREAIQKSSSTVEMALRGRIAQLENEVEILRRTNGRRDERRSKVSKNHQSNTSFNVRGVRSTTPPVAQQRVPPPRTRSLSPWENPRTNPKPRGASNTMSTSPRRPRFDPTEYQRQRLERLASHQPRAWGAPSDRPIASRSFRSREESGYSSANSQSSAGSGKRTNDFSRSRSPHNSKLLSSRRSINHRNPPRDRSSTNFDTTWERRRRTKSKDRNKISEKENPVLVNKKELQKSSDAIMDLEKDISTLHSRPRKKKEAKKRDEPGIDISSLYSTIEASSMKENSNNVNLEKASRLAIRRSLDRQIMPVLDTNINSSPSSATPQVNAVAGANPSSPSLSWDDITFNARKIDSSQKDNVVTRNSYAELQSRRERTSMSQGDEEISDIDKRISALQNYLDSARIGILNEVKSVASSLE